MEKLKRDIQHFLSFRTKKHMYDNYDLLNILITGQKIQIQILNEILETLKIKNND